MKRRHLRKSIKALLSCIAIVSIIYALNFTYIENFTLSICLECMGLISLSIVNAYIVLRF